MAGERWSRDEPPPAHPLALARRLRLQVQVAVRAVGVRRRPRLYRDVVEWVESVEAPDLRDVDPVGPGGGGGGERGGREGREGPERARGDSQVARLARHVQQRRACAPVLRHGGHISVFRWRPLLCGRRGLEKRESCCTGH